MTTVLLLVGSLTINGIFVTALAAGITNRASLSAYVWTVREYLGFVGPTSMRGPETSVVSCWGDSLTAGTGAGLNEDFCSRLASLLDRRVFVGGVGGETSTQIRKRMLSRPKGLDRGVTVLWVGRNNYREPNVVRADIDAMITSLPHSSHYIVLGIISGEYAEERRDGPGYQAIVKLNQELASAYLDRFIDIEARLMFAETRADGTSPLRADAIHLNKIGYATVAVELASVIRSRGW